MAQTGTTGLFHGPTGGPQYLSVHIRELAHVMSGCPRVVFGSVIKC